MAIAPPLLQAGSLSALLCASAARAGRRSAGRVGPFSKPAPARAWPAPAPAAPAS